MFPNDLGPIMRPIDLGPIIVRPNDFFANDDLAHLLLANCHVSKWLGDNCHLSLMPMLIPMYPNDLGSIIVWPIDLRPMMVWPNDYFANGHLAVLLFADHHVSKWLS